MESQSLISRDWLKIGLGIAVPARGARIHQDLEHYFRQLDFDQQAAPPIWDISMSIIRFQMQI
jgi:hypothetical protein